MATKKNKRKKQTKPKKAARKMAVPKKGAKKKAAPKKTTPKRRRVRGRSQSAPTVAFEREGLTARSGGQSGDLQGLSSMAGADSESVDELLEEGNAFEAEVVKGVQETPDADESEVVTHEVPEDDVPGEYLDKDQ
jgi:hypothetical protein